MNQRVADDAQEIVTLPDDVIIWNIVDIGEGARVNTHEQGKEVEEIIFDEVTEKVDTIISSLNAKYETLYR